MGERIAFLTNANEYVGPAAGPALAADGWTVFCHDDSFSTAEVRADFERANPGHYASEFIDPVRFVEAGLQRFGRIDCFVCNELPKGMSSSLDINAMDAIDDLLLEAEKYVDSLLLGPIRMMRVVVPAMKSVGGGSIIFITSGAPLRNPVIRLPHGYHAGRAGANALVKGLAVELAPLGIQVNAVAPFFVYSRNLFPSPLGAEDPQFAAIINSVVPAQRVGGWDEIGAVIELLASGRTRFLTGQVIAFSGAGC